MRAVLMTSVLASSLILAGVAVIWLGLMLGVREIVRRREIARGD